MPMDWGHPNVSATGFDILLVEDDFDFRELVAESFRDLGDHVRVVDDARMARQALAEALPDLVLLDLELPGASGLDLLAELGGPAGEVPVPFMVLSAHDGPEVRARAFFAGAAGFVSKRSEWRELRIQVEACIRVARSQRLPHQEGRLRRLDRLAHHIAEQVNHTLAGAGGVHGWQRSAGAICGDVLACRQTTGAGCRLLLADASGHDLAAGVLATFLAGVFEGSGGVVREPRSLLECCDGAVRGLLGESEFFATAVAVELDPGGEVLRIANAGHPPPLLLQAGEVHLLTEGGLPLGMGPQLPRTQQEVAVSAGDRLVVYSDGLLDEAGSPEGTARNRRRLHELVETSSGSPSEALLEELVRLVTARVDAPDDASVVILDVEAP